MTIFERLKNYWTSLRAVNGVDLPDAGRSSKETLGDNLLGSLAGGTVSPVVDFEMLKTLKTLWVTNPDMSQYVSNIVNIGNSGHALQIGARSSATIEAALKRLNEAAPRLYPNGAGVDGLINAYLAQIAWSGAVSSEDVVNLNARRVERVALVPVETIRFRFEDGDYVAYQRSNNFARAAERDKNNLLGLTPLNPNTYRYLALSTVENSPYAKPPASAAVESILDMQKPIFENVKYIAKKLGILGLITALVTPPTKLANESDAEYQKRSASFLQRVRDSLSGSFMNGLLVAFRNYKFEHTNVNASASGTYDINRMSEEQIMSALAQPPAFFGRTDSTTETYANVVYNLLLAQVSNMLRLAKRRQELTYTLDLRLGGIDFDWVSLKFNKAHSRDPLKDAQAAEVEQRIVFNLAEKGIISPDDAARMLGFDKAFDPSLLGDEFSLALLDRTARWSVREHKIIDLSFNRQTGRYECAPERLTLASSDDPVKKK